MTRAKAGQPLPRKECPNPVLQHMRLGVELGLTGTPFSVTETGETVSGYAPAAQLSARLDGRDASAPRPN